MIITLPRGVNIDIDNVPENLEEIVQETFAAYTTGTSRDYTYQDKLLFIDKMIENVHHADAERDITGLIVGTYKDEIDDQGRLMEPEEFYSVEFMRDCYSLGRSKARLYCPLLTNNRHTNEKVMKIVARVVKAVMNWEARE